MNQSILHFFNDLVHKSSAVDILAKFLIDGSFLIIPLVILAVYLIGIFARKERCRVAAIHTGCIVVLCLIVGFIIGQLVFEARPMYALNNVTVLLSHSNDSSFPSDHMLFCFGTAFGFWQISKRFSVMIMIFGLLVGIAKIYAAQHYPSDILLTILVAFAVYVLYRIFISKWVANYIQLIERRIFPFLHTTEE